MKKLDFYELQTTRDCVRYVYSQFLQADLCFGHGNATAWDEAVNLVLFAMHLPLNELEPFLDCRLTRGEKKRICKLASDRILKRMPLPYLTGEAWLQGLRFKTSPNVIIPRSPIAELLVEKLHPWIKDDAAALNVLDMCTGSGCLAVIAALAFPNAAVDAIDTDDSALQLARENIAEHGLEDRIRLIQSDLFTELDPAQKYDLIICNPPYVNQASMDDLPPEYCYEPQLALAGGDNGMSVVSKILAQAGRHLNSDGLLVLEIGHEYDHFQQAFPKLEPVWLDTAEAEKQIMLLTSAQLHAAALQPIF